MSITYDEIFGGRGSSLDPNWGRFYTRQWRAITDDPAIGPKTVRDSAPVARGDAYVSGSESDAGSFCQNLTVQEDGQANDGCQWIVTAEYGPFDVISLTPEVPTTQRPRVSFDWVEYERPLEQDANGDPIVNSAGDYFDPPVMTTVSNPLMRIERNEAGYNLGLVADCKGRINDALWFGRAAKTWKCVNILGTETTGPDGEIYFIVVYEFEYKAEGWDIPVLDQGMHELVSSTKVKIRDSNGSWVSSPWPLNADGTKKAATDDAEFIVFEYEQIDFTVFNLDAFYDEEVLAGRLI